MSMWSMAWVPLSTTMHAAECYGLRQSKLNMLKGTGPTVKLQKTTKFLLWTFTLRPKSKGHRLQKSLCGSTLENYSDKSFSSQPKFGSSKKFDQNFRHEEKLFSIKICTRRQGS